MVDPSDMDILLEDERELSRFLTQEIRFVVLQCVLGHPRHLPSIEELNHLIPQQSRVEITEAVETLIGGGILAEYTYEPDQNALGLPATFYGLTADGVETLEKFNLFSGKPVMRALYRKFDLPDTIRLHRDAPRPGLPAVVETALCSE